MWFLLMHNDGHATANASRCSLPEGHGPQRQRDRGYAQSTHAVCNRKGCTLRYRFWANYYFTTMIHRVRGAKDRLSSVLNDAHSGSHRSNKAEREGDTESVAHRSVSEAGSDNDDDNDNGGQMPRDVQAPIGAESTVFSLNERTRMDMPPSGPAAACIAGPHAPAPRSRPDMRAATETMEQRSIRLYRLLQGERNDAPPPADLHVHVSEP